jgi:hypothetical protein
MARFLIEVTHEAEEKACALAIQLPYKTGSHYLTNAEWGCLDGEHKGWVINARGFRRQQRIRKTPF